MVMLLSLLGFSGRAKSITNYLMDIVMKYFLRQYVIIAVKENSKKIF